MMRKNQTESQNEICCIMWNVREFVKLRMNSGIHFTNIPLFHLIKTIIRLNTETDRSSLQTFKMKVRFNYIKLLIN